jgi:hypothetical protein
MAITANMCFQLPMQIGWILPMDFFLFGQSDVFPKIVLDSTCAQGKIFHDLLGLKAVA